MSHYEKRVAALAAFAATAVSDREERNPFTEKKSVKLIEAAGEDSSGVKTSERVVSPYEDENRNIKRDEGGPGAETAVRQQLVPDSENNLVERTVRTNVETIEASRECRYYLYERDGETATKTILTRDHENTRMIRAANGSAISATNLEDIIMNYCTDNQPALGRPTFLNVEKIDNKTGTRMDRVYIPTPNNNEFKIAYAERKGKTSASPDSLLPDFSSPIVDNDNELGRLKGCTVKVARDSTEFQSVYSVDLQTPMSCTTDNLTSSIQSPGSQLQNIEDASPMEPGSTAGCATTSSPGGSDSGCDSGSDSGSSGNESELSFTSRNVRPFAFPSFFGFDREKKAGAMPAPTPAPECHLTVADVEAIDHTSLQAYLEKSVRIPLTIQSRLVNSAIIKYFLKEQELLSHLHNLRGYFFLLNGEFAKSLTDSLYTRLYEISIPVELFNSATLTNLLERALVNSLSNSYVNSGLLSLSALEPPLQLHISDPSALDSLSLNYRISWPLNIILDDTVMLQYGKVFKFLITSGRVSWVLQEDFNLMKRERKAATSEQYHKLQLYRHSMMQFMNALHNYLTCSVLHASWAEFEKDLQHSMTLDQIYFSHVNYIKRVLSRCMLNTRGEKMRVCLNNIFKVILKFHNRLRSQRWLAKPTGGFVHPNFKRLEQMYRAFCDLRGYMTHVAFKLATSGYQPHLMHFLNALNINENFELIVKSNRNSADATER